METIIAHIKSGNDEYITQTLEEHSAGTAELCKKFASAFNAAEWGYLSGLYHDLGKANPLFQDYIRIASGYKEGRVPGKMDHKSYGAIHLHRTIKSKYLSKMLGYCIAGHHSGLDDSGRLKERYEDALLSKIYEEIKHIAPVAEINENTLMRTVRITNSDQELHHWIRMLYSCLVDADWLDTESFMKPNDFAQRGLYKSLHEMNDLYKSHIDKFTSSASLSPINKIRSQIQEECIQKASLSKGLYSLTIPTGAGKTLSSLAWALTHAENHELSRIIVVIPYTSIITQTASIFRDIFGEENVVEHHSNIDSETQSWQNKLSSENWDAPVIVTTNVQFFESLYASSPSRCRKLHNICNSAIIFDEAQMFPEEFLLPVIHGIESLKNSFGCSILFTSATQPPFSGKIGSGREVFQGFGDQISAIISEDPEISQVFKRVEIEWPKDESKISFDELSTELTEYEQVLCIVNTRHEASELFRRMPEGTLHLSRNMCTAHIMDTIQLIKTSLKNGEPVRVISTQLVEAGVDIDFPVVYRAFAGLDSILQSAGRCNREGKLKHPGKVKVFYSEKRIPAGSLSKRADTLKDLLADADFNPFDPKYIASYFTNYYARLNQFDKPEVKHALYDNCRDMNFEFKTIGDKFQLIEDKNISFIVLYNESASLVQELKDDGPNPQLLRKLQRYTVSLPQFIFNQLSESGRVIQYGDLFIYNDQYHTRQGVIIENHFLTETYIL